MKIGNNRGFIVFIRIFVLIYIIRCEQKSNLSPFFKSFSCIQRKPALKIYAMKKLLFIALVVFGMNAKAQYTVTSIPYNPPAAYYTGTPVLVHTDDMWSSAVTLPFSFNFFGNPYSQLVIGANEIISFDLSYAGSCCPWELTNGVDIPTNTIPINSIMCPYQDIDPTNMGMIRFELIGTPPNRMVVVSFDSIPYYGGTGSVNTADCPTPPIYASSMLVLYETTNIIDIYIRNKFVCSGWNDGYAIEGIQDASGANAAVVPGRNNGGQWTATNDAWRFTPDHPSLNVNIVNIVNADCGSNNGSIITNVTGVSPFSFHWNSTPPQTGQNLINVPPGHYCVTVTDTLGDTTSICGTIDTAAYAAPDICMVTVDTSANYNLVVWEKPAPANGIDKYYVYRESSVAGVYNIIGSQNYSVYSTFVDSSSNSLQRSYRYELAIYDSCGNTSPLSSYHQTIHLTISAGTGGSWNLIWNDYIGFTYSTYKIFRGTNAGNLLVLDSVSSSVTSYTDLTPPSGIVYYIIEAVDPTTCYPSRVRSGFSFSSPISNIAESDILADINVADKNDGIRVYPNPATDNLIIKSPQTAVIEITNIQGQLIKTLIATSNKTNIDVSAFPSGVYVVEVKTEKEVEVKKFIKE